MGARLAIAKRLAACLSLLSPDMACKYLAGHARLSTLYGYDAAKRTGPNARWLPRDGKADSLISRDGRIIRAAPEQWCATTPTWAGPYGAWSATWSLPASSRRPSSGARTTSLTRPPTIGWKMSGTSGRGCRSVGADQAGHSPLLAGRRFSAALFPRCRPEGAGPCAARP